MIRSDDLERIWLEPRSPDDRYGHDGRTWCQRKVWPEDEGQPGPTEYVRADLAATELATLRESLAKAEGERDEALMIFANGAYDDACKRDVDIYQHGLALAVEYFRKAESRAAALQSQVKMLAGALAEFAGMSDDVGRPDEAMTGMRVSYRNLRRARTALATLEKPDAG